MKHETMGKDTTFVTDKDGVFVYSFITEIMTKTIQPYLELTSYAKLNCFRCYDPTMVLIRNPKKQFEFTKF